MFFIKLLANRCKTAGFSREKESPRRFFFFARVLLLAVLGGALVGCMRQTGLPPRENPLLACSGHYEATAAITCRDWRAAAVISRTTPHFCRVTFTAPENLNGISVTFGADAVEVAYEGLAEKFSVQALPGGAAAQVMTVALARALSDPEAALRRDGALLVLDSKTERGDFSLYLDEETGQPLKLLFPAEELTIDFVRFTFLA